ncbi:hypothetical protein MRB53_037666 [Persea americana]|nr:hypothetical protein MRB53_037666 [Persea americana]
MFKNIGRIGIELYLLFQHHTTHEILRNVHTDFDLFTVTGNGWHFVKYLGPAVVVVGPDCRSERSQSQVMAGPTYQGLFPKVAVLPDHVQHCIWMVPVPLIYPRLDAAEQLAQTMATGKRAVTGTFNALSKVTSGVAGIVGAKGVVGEGFSSIKKAVGKTGLMSNVLSPFGEIDMLDELRDLWTHETKDLERTYFIRTLQGISKTKSLRMTFFSGSTNTCGAGLVHDPSQPGDHKTMYQIISSSIVNAPPSQYVMRLLHPSGQGKPLYLPLNGHRTPSGNAAMQPTDTKEDMLDIFTQDVNGAQRDMKRLMGRRNYVAVVAYDPEVVHGAFNGTDAGSSTGSQNGAKMAGEGGKLNLAVDFMVQAEGGYSAQNATVKYGPCIIVSLLSAGCRILADGCAAPSGLRTMMMPGSTIRWSECRFVTTEAWRGSRPHNANLEKSRDNDALLAQTTAMPGPRTTLLIEGSFKELVEELADWIDAQKPDASSLRQEVNPLLETLSKAEESNDADAIETARDEVLEVVVGRAEALNTQADQHFIAAYNLLIHLVHQSPNINQYLQPLCKSIAASTAEASTPTRFGLALQVLSTVFNTLPSSDAIRLPILFAILDVVAKAGSFDLLRPHLPHIDVWLSEWNVNAQQSRRLFLRVSSIARDAGETELAYDYQVRALRTVTSSDAGSDEARKLTVEALSAALQSPTHFDFEDLTALDSVQALRGTEADTYLALLELFTSDALDDYVDFKTEHSGFIEKAGLDDAALTRKMRLLTLASLAAASGQTRSLPYAAIAQGLQIPTEDVEVWVIDVIRAGLVEGKLSQLNKTFLIHRSTYRVFRENQWREVAGRLDMWRDSLTSVLAVVRQEKENIIAAKESEVKAIDQKLNGSGMNYRRPANQQRDVIDVGMD